MISKTVLLRSAVLLFASLITLAAKAQDLVPAVQATLNNYGIPAAESVLKQYRDSRGVTPEYLEGYSWLGRKAMADRDFAAADKYAQQTYELCVAELKHRSLDAEPHLLIALGAAIEVHGQVLAAEGKRTMAVAYLRAEERKYGTTSIAERIQKNINLISLEGQPAPVLDETQFLGPEPRPLAAYRGKPVLLFFWAHWCVDCKAEAPILARLKQEYGNRLALLAPTQRYGYGAAGASMGAAEELKYIEAVWLKYYSALGSAPVPVSAANLKRYGASTTPTIVLVDAEGKVKLYHPGRMTYEELKSALTSVGLS